MGEVSVCHNNIHHFQRAKRRIWTWTNYRIDQGEKVIEIVNELEAYWPLTLRQIYYRLVAAGHIPNTRSRYKDLSALIKYMHLYDWLPWEVLEDRVRRVSEKRGWEDHTDFLEAHLVAFLEGYERCYVQDQERYPALFTKEMRASFPGVFLETEKGMMGAGMRGESLYGSFSDKGLPETVSGPILSIPHLPD
ncbi:MAG: hypothetical protein M0P73_10650 [Syntrophobacterales bacterium]|nr:hypothetical protein [Syntrophobacterales bacterium]